MYNSIIEYNNKLSRPKRAKRSVIYVAFYFDLLYVLYLFSIENKE